MITFMAKMSQKMFRHQSTTRNSLAIRRTSRKSISTSCASKSS